MSAVSASSCPLVLLAASHDLKSASELDESRHSSLGMNKPALRKKLIHDKIALHQEVEIRLLNSPLPDLSLASSVHTAGFCDFLNTAFARWSAIPDSEKDMFFAGSGTRQIGDVSSFVPAQSAPRNDLFSRPGDSLYSQCCYYGMDRLTPIRAETASTLRNDLAVIDESVKLIVSGAAKYIYALTTEPGHHSSQVSWGGYCYVNNSAVAADLLTRSFKKVATLDVDYHHSNGVQAIFYKRNDVLVTSIHADPANDYPYNSGFADETGADEGLGWSINVPLPPNTKWPVYRAELVKLIEMIKSRGCEALVVPLGLDTVDGDPEASPVAGIKLTMPDYVEMGELIRSLNIPTIFVQEGGYDMNQVAEAARNVVFPAGGK